MYLFSSLIKSLSDQRKFFLFVYKKVKNIPNARIDFVLFNKSAITVLFLKYTRNVLKHLYLIILSTLSSMSKRCSNVEHPIHPLTVSDKVE